jgi:hypothetical protein
VSIAVRIEWEERFTYLKTVTVNDETAAALMSGEIDEDKVIELACAAGVPAEPESCEQELVDVSEVGEA